jgi:hypothetical protein
VNELGPLPAIPLALVMMADPKEYNEEKDMRLDSVSRSTVVGCLNAASGSINGMETAIFWEASSLGVKSGSRVTGEEEITG